MKWWIKGILICISAILLSLGCNTLKEVIVDSINNRNIWIADLMRVTNEESLNYAVEHNISEFLMSGTATADQPKTYPELNHTFAGIRKIKYTYESHVESKTRTDSDGHTYIESRTVWDWERKNTEEIKTDTVTILGKSFPLGNVRYNFGGVNYSEISNNIEGKDGTYNYEGKELRYKYEIIPLTWNVTMVSNPNLEKIADFSGQSIEDVVKPQSTTWVKVLNIIFIIGIIGTAIGFTIKWWLEES